MKYKVGDEVRIKDLNGLRYAVMLENRRNYSGVVTKIVGIENDYYLLACDEKKYSWREESLASINYTCRTCGKVFHTKHGYYVHKSFHKCGRIDDNGILDERFKKGTAQTMMKNIIKNYEDNGIKIPKRKMTDKWHYERVGDMSFLKNFGVPIGSVNKIHKVFKDGKRMLLADVKDLTPEGQYRMIIGWLYENDKTFSSSKEWKAEFSKMLRRVLNLKEN
jgi:hypothetical protein